MKWSTLSRLLVIPLLIAAISLSGCGLFAPKQAPEKLGAGYYPGTLTSALPNYPYPVMTFTATAQTDTQPLSGVSYITISQTAATITTVTFQVQFSNDGGITFYNAACSPYVGSATAATVLTAITVTTVKNAFVCNAAGWTNMQIVTSGTFTATVFAIQVVGTSNKGVF